MHHAAIGAQRDGLAVMAAARRARGRSGKLGVGRFITYPRCPTNKRLTPRDQARQTPPLNGGADGGRPPAHPHVLDSVVSFLCLRPTGAQPVSFARKNETIESKFRTLELFPLHMFLAAKAPASTKVVS